MPDEVLAQGKKKCEAAAGNAYSEWVERQVAAHRSKGIERLFATVSETERAISLQKEALITAKCRLAANVSVSAGKAESCLHALERIPSEGRGKSVQFVPIRFIPTDKVTRDDKLLLGFDALVFSDSLGRKIVSSKLIHGSGFAVSQVKMPALFPLVRRKMQRIAELLAAEAPPDLALNRHCPECQFRNHCREKAIEKDDLSLLGGLSVKEREKLRNKGIFSVTQLSYTFRPRRRPKRLRHKAEKYRHALKALAIREKKIHLVGTPELKIKGTPVYLKFFNGGIKRWIVRYHFQRYKCCRCQKTFSNQAYNWARSKFGPSILAYAIYQNIGLRIPQITVDQLMTRVLGLRVGNTTCGHFKSDASDAYVGTYEQILRNLRVGPLLHADETRISIRSGYGFVWVFANLENVIYVYSETREAGLLQTVLKGFQGVLVSDFYAGYDGMECPQQKCLIHLIRDLNEALLKHPYDGDLKKQARSFTDLMTAIVRTIDRHGLKARLLKKHLSSVERFYRELSIMRPASEVARKCKDRFERNREGLFTFLRYDGVPWNNNNAEHAIKAFATLRHVIKGVTTEKGLREYLVLLSVCETCKYRGIDFLNFLRSGERDIDTFAKTRRRCSA